MISFGDWVGGANSSFTQRIVCYLVCQGNKTANEYFKEHDFKYSFHTVPQQEADEMLYIQLKSLGWNIRAKLVLKLLQKYGAKAYQASTIKRFKENQDNEL